MSGHSKWNNIKQKKGKTDAERGKIFTKISREIIVAVKEGGGDPASNSKLRDAIAKAKAANVPNDNIKRVIDRASGGGENINYEMNTYEGYGPLGIAVIVETMTDNKNRTASEMRHYFDKYGGNMGQAGCVSWSFDKKGVMIVDKEESKLNEDTVMMDALESGADDFEAGEDVFEIYSDPDSFSEVRTQLEEKGYSFLSAQVEMVPQNYVKLDSEEDRLKMEKMLSMFEDNDDVQNVWHNWEQ